VPQYLF